MGTYVNPGNSGFARIAGDNYVDKTGLIGLMNQRIGGERSLVCISRPRRFGKSYAAKMLAAYYDHSCNSHELFDQREVAGTKEYRKHINKYNVLQSPYRFLHIGCEPLLLRSLHILQIPQDQS